MKKAHVAFIATYSLWLKWATNPNVAMETHYK